MEATRDDVRRVVLFDGVCALCDASVRFLLAVDRGQVLSFAPLQGETAREILARHPKADRSLSTVLYARSYDEEEMVYDRSDAAFRILEDIGGLWRVLSLFRFVPRPIRDGLYRWVATHRYRWFGKLDECRLPSPGDQARFLP